MLLLDLEDASIFFWNHQWAYTVLHLTYIEGHVCTCVLCVAMLCNPLYKKVQVGKDQEKAQSEKDSHSKNRGGKKPN